MKYKQYILSIFAGFLVVVGVSAFTFTGTPDEWKQMRFDDVLGARNIENIITHGRLEAQGTASSTFGNNIIAGTNNLYDIGGYGSAFRNIFASGTIYGGTSGLSFDGNLLPSVSATYDLGSASLQWDELWVGTLHATIAADINEDLTIGDGSTTSTLTVGARGNATSTFYSDISIVNRDLIVGGDGSASGWLWVGNGVATTSIRGGAAGATTSTFQGDVDISNLFAGMLSAPLDGGIVDMMDIPVSSSAATGTKQALNFTSDGLAVAQFAGTSDALGSVYNLRFEMTDNAGNATTTFQQPRNTSTTTIYLGAKESAVRGIGTCIVMQGDDGVRYYVSIVGGTLTASTVSCENTGLGLKRD